MSNSRSRCYRPKASRKEAKDGTDRQTQLAILVMTETLQAFVRSAQTVTGLATVVGTSAGSELRLIRRDFSIAFLGHATWASGFLFRTRELTEAHRESLNTPPKMFYDLNVPYSSDDPEISHTLNFLAESTSLARSSARFFAFI